MEKVYVRLRVPRASCFGSPNSPITPFHKVTNYLDTNCILLSKEEDGEFHTATRRYSTYGGAVVELKSSPSRNPDKPNYEVEAEFFDNQRKARKSLEKMASELGLFIDDIWDEVRKKVI